jgi:hypothetical protein
MYHHRSDPTQMPNVDSFRIYDDEPDAYRDPIATSTVHSRARHSAPTGSNSLNATRHRVTFRDQTATIPEPTGDQLLDTTANNSTGDSSHQSDDCSTTSAVTVENVQTDVQVEAGSLDDEPLDQHPESIVDDAIVQERNALRQELAILRRRTVGHSLLESRKSSNVSRKSRLKVGLVRSSARCSVIGRSDSEVVHDPAHNVSNGYALVFPQRCPNTDLISHRSAVRRWWQIFL